jgi:hypothetical protein
MTILGQELFCEVCRNKSSRRTKHQGVGESVCSPGRTYREVHYVQQNAELM